MLVPRDFEVVRDPLWNNIRLDGAALDVLDSEPFQRLRYIRQLGHAFLVYPGATHTRFEHALGAYHLAGRALGLLAERGELAGLPGGGGAERIVDLIRGRSESPLAGLISGSLDLDKIDYLTRDARMCGVPYGTVDVDRLLHSITLVALADGRRAVGVHEKGASALESLTFAKYQMYRNVYWHHAVRSATAMFKRLVRTAIARGQLDAAWISRTTDEALMERLRQLPDTPLAARLRRRRLYKRLADLPATEVPAQGGEWIAGDPELVAQVEDRLAEELHLEPAAILLDFPAKPEMVAIDLPLMTRRGVIEPAQSALEAVADALHRNARCLRVFGAEAHELDPHTVVALAELTAAEVREALNAGTALLER